MPQRTYHGRHEPPTVVDHIHAHPFELAIAGWGILAGLVGAIAATTDVSVSVALKRLPDLLVLSIAALLIFGGLAIIYGLLDDSDDLVNGWRHERPGLILTATGWLSYAVVVLFTHPASVLAWSQPLVLAAALIIRYRATVHDERRIRGAIR